MKNILKPFIVIGNLKQAFDYYIDENEDSEEMKAEWKQSYRELLHAYHIFTGVKKDYRKK
jgi:hypothetical protein